MARHFGMEKFVKAIKAFTTWWWMASTPLASAFEMLLNRIESLEEL